LKQNCHFWRDQNKFRLKLALSSWRIRTNIEIYDIVKVCKYYQLLFCWNPLLLVFLLTALLSWQRVRASSRTFSRSRSFPGPFSRLSSRSWSFPGPFSRLSSRSSPFSRSRPFLAFDFFSFRTSVGGRTWSSTRLFL